MGFLDRLLGREPEQPRPTYGREPALPPQGSRMPTVGQAVGAQDQQAIARYKYLLRTAPPEQIEQAHAEAFAQLTPDQRRQVLGQLSQDLPQGEAPRSDDPRDLARSATRAELRQPGYLTGPAFAGGGFGGGFGTSMMGSMMGTVAGFVIGGAIADAFFDDHAADFAASPEAADAGMDGDAAGFDGAGADGAGYDGTDAGGDLGSGGDDAGGDYSGGADLGGGDFGGDFGGGDFGGGDFGGFGDF